MLGGKPVMICMYNSVLGGNPVMVCIQLILVLGDKPVMVCIQFSGGW